MSKDQEKKLAAEAALDVPEAADGEKRLLQLHGTELSMDELTDW